MTVLSCHDGQTCGREIRTVTKENKAKTIEELDKDETRDKSAGYRLDKSSSLWSS
jgi:hypothetical protein